MKHKRLMALLLALAMMITFMPTMAFAEDKTPGEAPNAIGWEIGLSGQYAKWQPITGQEYKDDFWFYGVKAFWESPDGTKTADSSSVYPEDTLNNGYCVANGATTDSWFFGEFFEAYGPGKYSFEVKAVYRYTYEESNLSKCQEASFNGAKVIIRTFDNTGAESDVEGGSAMFSLGENQQYNRIESGNYLTFANNTTLRLEANPYSSYSFDGYSFAKSTTVLTDKVILYTLTEDTKDDEITLTFRQGDTVPVTVVLGKGHEVLARGLCSEIQEDDKYACSLNSDETELTIQWPNANKKIEDVMSYVKSTVYGSDASSKEERKSFYGTGLKELSKYSGYDDREKEEKTEWEKDIPADGIKIYVHWAKPAKSGSFSVAGPICGTDVTVKGSGYPFDPNTEQTNRPVVKADNSSDFDLQSESWMGGSFQYWVKTKELRDLFLENNLYAGKIEGGKSYIAGFFVYPKFGYYIDYEYEESDPQPLGGDDFKPLDPGRIPILGGDSPTNVGLPVINAEFKVNGKTVEAQYYEMIYLAADVNANHDWGAWTVTRKPTAKKEGEETRTCKHCGATETRPIPKKGKSPKTADESYPILWIAVMLMAMAMLACTATVRIRQRRRRSE